MPCCIYLCLVKLKDGRSNCRSRNRDLYYKDAPKEKIIIMLIYFILP